MLKKADNTFLNLLQVQSLSQPNQLAFLFLQDGEVESDRLTYQDLDQRAKAIAAQLQQLGTRPERALLLYPPGLDFITAFFGCLYAGVVAVPIYPPRRNQKLSRLLAILADAQATVALTTTPLLGTLEHQFKQNPEFGVLHWLTTDNIAPEQASGWHEPQLTPHSLAFLQYTSGSTGTPKGVKVTHGNLLHNQQMIQTQFQHSPDSTFLSWLPLYHDMGLIGNVLQPLYLGSACILMSPQAFLQKPLRWLQAISRYKIRTSGGPNFAYDLCVRKIKPPQRATLDLSCWEIAYNGAEPIRAETLTQFTTTFAPYGFRPEAFYPCYGMAEATLFVSGGVKTAPPIVQAILGEALEQNQAIGVDPDQANSRMVVGCGQTGCDQQIVIVNPESLTPCLPDQVGEIWVSSASVAQGYWNRPSETEQTFQAYLADSGNGPFLRTGDLGFLKAGELFVTGRLKDLMIIRGLNYYPQDIEQTVEESHSSLRLGCGAAVVVEVEGEERLVIVQEVEREYFRKLDVDSVQGDIKQAIAEQHGLQVYAITLLPPGSIPKTSSGKIQRYVCKARFLAGTLQALEAEAKSSALPRLAGAGPVSIAHV